MTPRPADTGRVLTPKQRVALQALEDAFVGIVQQGYNAGLDASWILLALWHASDRVEGLPPIADVLAAGSSSLTPGTGSTIVERASRQKKTRKKER